MAMEQIRINGSRAAIKAISNIDHNVDLEYIVANDASVINYNMYRPEEGNIIWWVKNYNRNGYTVYTFSGGEFINGFINIAEQMGVDFRDYVLGAPYGIINGKIINYDIEGYDLLPYKVNNRISAPIGPFYTGSVEDDGYNPNWE